MTGFLYSFSKLARLDMAAMLGFICGVPFAISARKPEVVATKEVFFSRIIRFQTFTGELHRKQLVREVK